MGIKVYAAIPVLNELENLPGLLEDLLNQQNIEWVALLCINQPEEWWKITEKISICNNNKASVELLKSKAIPGLHIIDKSSQGNGWIGKNHGVGWARKTAMDAASGIAGSDDLIVSMDADTRYSSCFFQSVVDSFERHPGAAGLSAPYYHDLTGDVTADRCILRYEIYMRNFALNMLLIDNPYAFSAIGSGMACTAGSYRKIGGMTPKMSGEDFYFIQKLRKSGNIIIDSGVYVKPASRFSDRVYFGTGPAMIKGREGNWDSYPIYHTNAFEPVQKTYNLFSDLFDNEINTPMDAFLYTVTRGQAIWQPLRNNAATRGSFVRACMQRVDALRILQFLKEKNGNYPGNNEQRLKVFLESRFNTGKEINQILRNLNFASSEIRHLDTIRNFMSEQELLLQKQKGIV
ncbi:MAG: glycosyltransferase [Bacteroidales bacterium]|nr:glycosyltransferase [Bacteroidales bacterium]